MRIALVSQEYPPRPHGGIGSQTRLKALGLAGRGHDVHVIAHGPDGSRQEYRENEIRVTRIPGGDDRLSIHNEAVRWLTWSVEVAVVLADLHSKAEFDLIDFAEWGGEGYVHLLNRVPWSYTPTVIQLHGPLVMFAHTMGWPDVDSEFYRVGMHMEETCLRLADAVFSSSRCSIEWCARHYGLDPAAAPVLHTGVDVDLFKPRKDVSRTHPTIVFVGKLVKNKGVDLLVDAAIQLRKQFPDLQLWLVGRGEPSFVRGLQERVDSVGAAGLLQMKGFVERERLAELLPCAHVFAAPAVYEGGPGFVYLEAMACGLPVIACGGSGASEVIQPGVTGLLVPPGEVEPLQEALYRLLSDREMRDAMGERGRDYTVREADSRVCLQ